jgi:hypothetical protein
MLLQVWSRDNETLFQSGRAKVGSSTMSTLSMSNTLLCQLSQYTTRCYVNSLNVQHSAPEGPEGMLIDKVIICARDLTCTISFMEESDVTCC